MWLATASGMLAEKEPDPTEYHGLGLTVIRTYVRVSEYGYTVTTHDPDRPWIVLGREHRTVELKDGESFALWAAQHWPASRFTVELDPGRTTPEWR